MTHRQQDEPRLWGRGLADIYGGKTGWIARRAYEIWEQAGRPDGQDKKHWQHASATSCPLCVKPRPGNVD
ncbi:DUF2934 domain-containing protein [Neorhizobium sp. LMR1-1-1.1]